MKALFVAVIFSSGWGKIIGKRRILPLRAKRNWIWPTSVDNVGCHNYRVLLTSSGYIERCWVNILQCPGQLPTTKNYPAPMSIVPGTRNSDLECLFWILRSIYLLLKFHFPKQILNQLLGFTFHFLFSLVAVFHMFIRRNLKKNTLDFSEESTQSNSLWKKDW